MYMCMSVEINFVFKGCECLFGIVLYGKRCIRDTCSMNISDGYPINQNCDLNN